MELESTKMLLMAGEPGRYFMLECAAPLGVHDVERIVLCEADGEVVTAPSADGKAEPPVLARTTLNDFLRHRFVQQDGSDTNHNIFYRVTRLGLEHARSAG